MSYRVRTCCVWGFDIYANPDTVQRRQTPYFLNVQNAYIDALDTRVVIPLRREAAFGPQARDLHPRLEVNGDAVVLDTAALGAVPTAELRKQVTHLIAAREQVQAALDTLFGAY